MGKPDIDAFLEAVRSVDEPGPNDRARIHRAFGDKLARQGYAAPAPPIPGGTALPPAAAAPATTALGARVAWLLLGSAAVTGALIAVLPSKPAAESHAHMPSVQAAATAAVAAAPPAQPGPTLAVGEGASPKLSAAPRDARTAPLSTSAPRRMHHAVADPARAGAGSGGSLAQEIALIAAARSDLQAGRADAALEHLTEHARRFRHGALRDEREGLRVLSLCELRRFDAASGARERFLARAPSSLLAAQVRAACAP